MDPLVVKAQIAQAIDPALAALGILSAVLCLGTLFSVSWIVSRARFIADATEAGQLALGLFRRRSIPFGLLALGCLVGWALRTRPDLFHAHLLVGLAVAAFMLAALEMHVGGRARRAALGVRR